MFKVQSKIGLFFRGFFCFFFFYMRLANPVTSYCSDLCNSMTYGHVFFFNGLASDEFMVQLPV